MEALLALLSEDFAVPLGRITSATTSLDATTAVRLAPPCTGSPRRASASRKWLCAISSSARQSIFLMAMPGSTAACILQASAGTGWWQCSGSTACLCIPAAFPSTQSCQRLGAAALPIRAPVFACTTDPMILIAAQVFDGVSGTMLGVLTALTVADLTIGTGRFNLALGFVGTMSGVGASLSTALSGLLAGSLGRAAGFTGIAAVALAAVLLLWFLMPETNPLNRSGPK